MKKLIALLTLLALCCTACIGFAETDADLAAARSYLRTMYKNATETTPVDYTVVGVINIDETLIKAARVLGANDKDIFIRVIAPATLPFILTAIRLGASVALTTLIAAESTGATAGLGMRIRSLNNSFEPAPMLLYIILIGILGITIEKLIKFAERRLTSWQEKREI